MSDNTFLVMLKGMYEATVKPLVKQLSDEDFTTLHKATVAELEAEAKRRAVDVLPTEQ